MLYNPSVRRARRRTLLLDTGEMVIAILLPLVGVFYGLALVVRKEDRRGREMIWLSVVMGIIWAAVPWLLWGMITAALIGGIAGGISPPGP